MSKSQRTSLSSRHASALIDLKAALSSMASGAVMEPRRARGGGGAHAIVRRVKGMVNLLAGILQRVAHRVKNILRYFGERP